ncbi:MAG TPA: U32 family peptidase [Candidatus Goldiibacteriota bacterium]|nr:U32 family peptidase [Candidatus Goldiibacteriota bacterium]
MKSPEILSPAGNLEKLQFAFAYGADAVYVASKKFSLRSYAGNLSDEELEEAVKLTHKNNKKIYVTLNVFPYNDDIEDIEKYLHFLKSLKVDGIIVSDLGVFSLTRKICPDVPIHISVQANNLNYMEVETWKKLGAKRVILSRELPYEDILKIRNFVPDVELEIFVHGAMCMSYSGRCLLSNYLTGRDSNKGECAQSCRWKYNLVEEKRPGECFPVFEDSRGTYILNSKDLCVIKSLHKFIGAGIDSFKIEGRMKSVHYVAVTTSIYKKVRDEYMKNREKYEFKEEYMKELEKISHRPYIQGFYFRENEKKQNYEFSDYVSTFTYAGHVIEDNDRDNMIKIKVKNTFRIDDEIEFFMPDGNFFTAKVIEIKNSENIDELYAKQDVEYFLKIDKDIKIPEFTIIRRQKTKE